MKTRILSIIAIITMSFASNAQIDRSTMPTPGPDPVVKLGTAEKFSLENGLTVIMVENHKLPRVSATLRIDNQPYFEGEIAGVSSMMGSLLGRGTSSITKDEFNNLLINIKKNRIVKSGALIFLRFRDIDDYRFGNGNKFDDNAFTLDTSDEKGNFCQFYRANEMINILTRELDLRSFRIFNIKNITK